MNRTNDTFSNFHPPPEACRPQLADTKCSARRNRTFIAGVVGLSHMGTPNSNGLKNQLLPMKVA